MHASVLSIVMRRIAESFDSRIKQFIYAWFLQYLAKERQAHVDSSSQSSAQVGGASQDVAQVLIPHEFPASLLNQLLNLGEHNPRLHSHLANKRSMMILCSMIPLLVLCRISQRLSSCCRPSPWRWCGCGPLHWSRLKMFFHCCAWEITYPLDLEFQLTNATFHPKLHNVF